MIRSSERLLVTIRSRNQKTGPMPVVTSSRDTCPRHCPLRAEGCYALHGPLGWHWKALDEGRTGHDLDTLLGYLRKLTPNKLWRYAGLGFRWHESGGRVYQTGWSRSGNRVLKWIVREHFYHAVDRAHKPNRFVRQHRALRARGLCETDARRLVCRSLLSTVRALWMKGESYRDRPMT